MVTIVAIVARNHSYSVHFCVVAMSAFVNRQCRQTCNHSLNVSDTTLFVCWYFWPKFNLERRNQTVCPIINEKNKKKDKFIQFAYKLWVKFTQFILYLIILICFWIFMLIHLSTVYTLVFVINKSVYLFLFILYVSCITC